MRTATIEDLREMRRVRKAGMSFVYMKRMLVDRGLTEDQAVNLWWEAKTDPDEERVIDRANTKFINELEGGPYGAYSPHALKGRR